MGQIIFAVVAETDVQAKRAIEKIKITYEELEPIIFTIKVSRVPGLSYKVVESEVPCKLLNVRLIQGSTTFSSLVYSGKINFSGRHYLHELKLALVPRNRKKIEVSLSCTFKKV